MCVDNLAKVGYDLPYGLTFFDSPSVCISLDFLADCACCCSTLIVTM